MNSLITVLSRFECSSLSPTADFVLNERSARDAWVTEDHRVGTFLIQLLVVHDPSREDDTLGYTKVTTSMLYQVHVLGQEISLSERNPFLDCSRDVGNCSLRRVM